MAATMPIALSNSAQLIGELCGRSGLRPAELARRSGIPRSVLSAYMHGHRQPGADMLARLCAAAGFKLDLSKRTAPVDVERASSILLQVLELAEALPYSPKKTIRYPPLSTKAVAR